MIAGPVGFEFVGARSLPRYAGYSHKLAKSKSVGAGICESNSQVAQPQKYIHPIVSANSPPQSGRGRGGFKCQLFAHETDSGYGRP